MNDDGQMEMWEAWVPPNSFCDWLVQGWYTSVQQRCHDAMQCVDCFLRVWNPILGLDMVLHPRIASAS